MNSQDTWQTGAGTASGALSVLEADSLSARGACAGSAAVLPAIYRAMFMSRESEALEKNYTSRGEASFFLSSAGHEAGAALAPHLISEDWLHCHYRDRALMLARGMRAGEFFLSLFSKDGSFSRGRQMHGLVSCARLNILSLPTPVGNGALQAAGVAAVIKDRPRNPLVLCSLGEGSSQEGEVLEAFAHAARENLPVLFFIQDNGLAISTPTEGKTFFSVKGKDGIVNPESIFGIPIIHADGSNAEEMYHVFGGVVRGIRTDRLPRIVVARMQRLSNHSNADDQRLYREAGEIETIRRDADPLVILRNILIRNGESPQALEALEAQIRAELSELARESQCAPDPRPCPDAVKSYPAGFQKAERENRGAQADCGGMTMLEALKETLRFRLETDPRVFLFGEDIEDPKGDVFGLTRGLSTDFPGRVVNSPLAESTILGYTTGRALAGDRPVAFLQFADFMPVAFNQIFSEMANIFWRTGGSWDAPLIVMATCGAYRPGLGPFHASSMEAFAAHIPGVDVFMPSTAADAAGLLNAAFESGRPTIFLYPKALLNDRSALAVSAAKDLFVPPGKARFARRGSDISFVSYGNTLTPCLRAADTLREEGITSDVIDLRSIQPWDEEAVCASAARTGRLLIAHEDSKTCGMGAEIAASVAENSPRHVAIRRVTRPDTWVPFNFENQLDILPSYKSVLEAAVSLLGGEITWREAAPKEEGVFVVKAAGSSPADESVTVIAWKVKAGENVREGMLLAELEADKAALELTSPVTGRVARLLVEEGFAVKVGTPLMYIQTLEQAAAAGPPKVSHENPGIPEITGLKKTTESLAAAPAGHASRPYTVGMLGIAGALGSRLVSNEEISELCPTWLPEDIVKRTGIESRNWLGHGETVLTLAADASRKVLAKTGLKAQDIELIICSTGTPLYSSPALAAMIQYELAGGENREAERADAETSPDWLAQAYDISAACCGYLYGLQIVWDYLQSRPQAKVLLVTAETLSTKTDTADPSTAPIFGDAATATILAAADPEGASGIPFSGGSFTRLSRPVLSAQGEAGDILRVPTCGCERIFMNGQKVFLEAVRGMMMMLGAACEADRTPPDKLDLIVPHQANQRIINAVRQKLRLPEEKVFSNIRNLGNSSSSTIPLCLQTILSGDYRWPQGAEKTRKLGLAAFGGGFTFGGAILEVTGKP
ncbi:MAG: transketolase [Spirochaetales bacterium]|jgi:2-oxoisovalerate dehydrogenase E1 component|nr:transketolase [Spirochaetales bacterium]